MNTRFAPYGLVSVGDLVVASDVVNYEFDCRNFLLPWDPTYRHALGELPFTGGLKAFPSHPRFVALALSALEKAAADGSKNSHHVGRIVTGSEFLTTERKAALAPVWAELSGGGEGGGKEAEGSGSASATATATATATPPLAVEMECAAVAQVCLQFGVPFLGLRAISDTTTGDANEDFNAFCQEAADRLWPVVEHVAKNI